MENVTNIKNTHMYEYWNLESKSGAKLSLREVER